MYLSKRIKSVETSPVRKLVPYAAQAIEKGKKVYHLNIGQPDVKTPREFFDAISTFDEDVLGYAPSQGTNGLIDEIINYYKRLNSEYCREDVLITNGGSEALLFALTALCDAGDDILMAEPYYANYNSFFKMLEINVSPVRTYAEDGFHLPLLEEIEKAITKKTRAILISNPGNPTGTVYTEDEMRRIAELSKKHNFYIISDEVYREFTYGGRKAISFSTFKDVEDRVILIDSISKRYSACGARIGCVISKNREFIEEVYKLCQMRLAVPLLEMIGAEALYKVEQQYFDEVNKEYERRRDCVYKELMSMNEVVCSEPEGAFYTVAKLPVDDAEKFVIWLLSEFDIDGETVMMAPAEGFYSTPGLGRNEVRICYALNIDSLKKAMNILREGLISFASQKENSLPQQK